MNEIRALHHRSMEFVDNAAAARRRGDISESKNALRQAFALERDAAHLTVNALNLEPTRSVLHRSAATLALECGEHREAEKLIATALCGNPPMEIAEELRTLLEQVYHSRHLRLIEPGE